MIKFKDILQEIKATAFNHRGSQINRLQFSEIEDYLNEKGINVDNAFNEMADEHEYIYVSNGFINALDRENDPSEWHHYFIKDGSNHFIAKKLRFK